MNNIVTQATPETYPVDAFPFVARNVITELEGNFKAPQPMIACSVLAAMSAVVQRSAKIKLPYGGEPRPLGLYVLVVAESGEGKTTIEKLISKSLNERDELLEAQYQEELRKFEGDYEVWSSLKKGYIRRLTAARVQNLPTEEWEERLEQHQKDEPKKPKNCRLIRQDLTERALLDAMEGKGASLAVMSDEAEIIFRSPLLQKNGVLNKAWDGGPLVFDRAKGVSFAARDIRLTASLMTQPAVIQDYLRRRGEMARGTGFFARFLMCCPQSMKGYRYNSGSDPSWISLGEFHRRTSKLIESQIFDHFEDCYLVLEFDDDARDTWFNFINNIEADMRPGMFLDDISDFASKAGEMVARIAGIFHVFSGQTGWISNDTVQRAIRIMKYHIMEFKKLFSDSFKIPEWEVDANAVLRYLHRNFYSFQIGLVSRNDLYRCGPVRDRARFATALTVLGERRFIWIGLMGKKKQVVNLNLPMFQQLPAVF